MLTTILITAAVATPVGVVLGFAACRFMLKRDPAKLERLYREAKKLADKIRS